MSVAIEPKSEIHVHDGSALRGRLEVLERLVARREVVGLSFHPAWPLVLARGLGHVPYCLEALRDGETVGILPLCFVQSFLFGKYLVGLPYLNVGGVLTVRPETAGNLVDAAAKLAERLDVKHLELRHETELDHPGLEPRPNPKVHMRLRLPDTTDALWRAVRPEVRNQVRKAEKLGLHVAWGGAELLSEFYEVFSVNMRDLGTPVYHRRLFAEILSAFPGRAELAVVRLGSVAVAAGLLVHGWRTSEILSASSMRKYNHTCANMLLYWHLLMRSIERGHAVFDFGRSSPDSGPYRFKKQWGARPEPAPWQYRIRRGTAGELRPDSPKYRRMVQVWRRLPVPVTRLMGPPIVRGIP